MDNPTAVSRELSKALGEVVEILTTMSEDLGELENRIDRLEIEVSKVQPNAA